MAFANDVLPRSFLASCFRNGQMFLGDRVTTSVQASVLGPRIEIIFDRSTDLPSLPNVPHGPRGMSFGKRWSSGVSAQIASFDRRPLFGTTHGSSAAAPGFSTMVQEFKQVMVGTRKPTDLPAEGEGK